jgi:hypothetical protein
MTQDSELNDVETDVNIIEDKDLIEFEDARKELFGLNGITEEMVSDWKEKYLDIGWTSFLISGTPHAVVFVYRSITRREWKKDVKPAILQLDDPDDIKEYLCSAFTLYPLEAKDVEYWDSAPAFLPDTLDNLITNVSGAETQTQPMKL